VIAGGERSRSACASVLLILAAGCVPWQTGGPAPVLEPGKWEVGAGLSWLAPPSVRPWRGLPAPQLWVSRGLGSELEARLSWAPPLSLEGLVKLELGDWRGATYAVQAGGGWLSYGGAFDVPVSHLPYASFGMAVSGGGTEPEDPEDWARVPFGDVGVKIPFIRHQEERTAFAVWTHATFGMEWSREEWWIAPRIGGILAIGQRDRWMLLPAVSGGRR
jgi:hypothetical protein